MRTVTTILAVLIISCAFIGCSRDDIQEGVDKATGKSTIEMGEKAKARIMRADSLAKERVKGIADEE